MPKRIILLIITIVTCFSLFGCNVNTLDSSLDGDISQALKTMAWENPKNKLDTIT